MESSLGNQRRAATTATIDPKPIARLVVKAPEAPLAVGEGEDDVDG